MRSIEVEKIFGTASPTKTSGPFRFTLGGLFICLLGVAIGLAWWRVPSVTVPGALLACFSTWFVLGMLQRLRWGVTQLRSTPQSAHVRREMISSVGICALLAVVAAAYFCTNDELAGAGGGIVLASSRDIFANLIDVSFFLVIISAYWSRPVNRKRLAAPFRWVGVAFQAALLVLGAIWLVKLLVEWVAVLFGLVHIAIQGVIFAQPLRWGGRQLTTYDPQTGLADVFLGRANQAVVLLAIGICASVLTISLWSRGWVLRLIPMAAAGICLGGTAWHVHWCLTDGYPRLSPFFAEVVALQPSENFAIAFVMSLAAAMLISYSRTIEVQPGDMPFASGNPQQPYLHEHVGVICVCLVAVLWLAASDFWPHVAQFGPTLSWLATPRFFYWPVIRAGESFIMEQPEKLIHLAAAFALIRNLWSRRHGAQQASTHAWTLHWPKFATAVVLFMLTTFFMVVVSAWWAIATTMKAIETY